eukprot:569437-Amorphochlora_amoeboformis.AAC.1
MRQESEEEDENGIPLEDPGWESDDSVTQKKNQNKVPSTFPTHSTIPKLPPRLSVGSPLRTLPLQWMYMPIPPPTRT